jgi:sterol desaturase/sphingolipid hydroxylase (fatty acid hydroxylase superfamily)
MGDIAITTREAYIRLAVFAAALTLFFVWERRATAAATPISPPWRRWSSNFGIGIINAFILHVVFPAGPVGVALLAARYRLGLFNHVFFTGFGAQFASVVILDLAVYWQHRLFHQAPWLWRIHRVHHADPAVDVSTALRFHPAESVLSMLLKSAVVLCFGLPAIGVLLFEAALNVAAMFNHAEVSLGRRAERWLRSTVVTPDMHRLHHSPQVRYANGNFGTCTSCWDRLFGSYRCADSSPGRAPVGLPDGAPSPDHIRLPMLLSMPFRP